MFQTHPNLSTTFFRSRLQMMLAAGAQVRVPKEVSDEEAAQFLVNPVTAYGCAPGSINHAQAHASWLHRLSET